MSVFDLRDAEDLSPYTSLFKFFSLSFQKGISFVHVRRTDLLDLLPPVKRSSEIIIELTGTTNQIAVFYYSNGN